MCMQWLPECHGIHLNVWHAALSIIFNFTRHTHCTFEYIRVPNFITRIKSINFTNYNVNFYDLKWYSNGHKIQILIDRKNPRWWHTENVKVAVRPLGLGRWRCWQRVRSLAPTRTPTHKLNHSLEFARLVEKFMWFFNFSKVAGIVKW